MAAKCDSEMGPASDHASGTLRKRCDLCATDLERDWPDLSLINPRDIKNHAEEEWRRAAELGCSFCNIIVSISDDAAEQYGCSFPADFKSLDLKWFQVFLCPNGSTGRYTLALTHVWMPLLAGPGFRKEFWGAITVHLDEADIFNLNLQAYLEIPKHAGSGPSLKGKDLLSASNASIRILQICEDTLRLMPVELRGPLPPFVALSHCWGSSPTLKTRLANIETFQTTGIPLGSLPATFKDATRATKSLGFDFMWIDSLCIIQDSQVDWAEQSSLMASIYGNADLVLAASSASSAEDGFFRERESYQESSLELRCVRDNTRTLVLRYRLVRPKDMAPMRDPLDRRAWAFQERLLARRYLAFGSHDTSWTCMTSSDCECGWWKVNSEQEGIENINKVLRDATDDELGDCWRIKALFKYTGRSLTFPSDNLVALSAIASIFHARLGTDYYAGLWQGDLIPDLLWDFGGFIPGNYGLDHSAPSWSWASFALLPRIIYNLGEIPKKYAAEVIEASTTPSTVNQFGPVSSGFIKLWGRLWRVKIAPDETVQGMKVKGHLEEHFLLYMDTSLIMTDIFLPDGTKERSVRRVRREEAQDKFFVGNFQEGETLTVFMVALYHEEDNGWGVETFQGLILGRSQKDPTKFERVGKFDTFDLTAAAPNEQDEDGMEENDEQEIVIV
ncbi:hypothetical protein Daus18300_006131 [Diaporthe australafricana]|uniref:Heterokaryon incompatibility domain-containing protein n=1 Tax=Diaporthe australafricana TaxID=127596 RepID=A0ABR3WW18_9PEZI